MDPLNLWTVSFGPDYCIPYFKFSTNPPAGNLHKQAYTFTT